MLSDAKFHDKGYYISDKDEIRASISQKIPIHGEKFYLIVNENDPEFELDIQVFPERDSQGQFKSKATMFVEFEEWDSLPGMCQIQSVQ